MFLIDVCGSLPLRISLFGRFSDFVFFLEKLFESLPFFVVRQNEFRVHADGQTFDVATFLANLDTIL
jgi:hypothetical protein